MKHIINRADIIGGLKCVELAKKNPQYYQPGVGVTEEFKLKKVQSFLERKKVRVKLKKNQNLRNLI